MSSAPMDEYTIIRCSPAQVLQTRENHFPHWGVHMGAPRDLYLHWDEALRQTPLLAGDRHATWALVRRDADEGTLDLLAHCETFKRDAAYVPPGADAPVPTYSYAIAAVFCPPAQRGRGYPRLLLRQLHYVLAPAAHLPPFPAAWGAPPAVPGFRDCRFSVLYSGIGDKYYGACTQGDGERARPGWTPVGPMVTRTWETARAGEPAEIDAGWDWLDADGLKRVGNEAADGMVAALAREGEPSRTRVAVLPRHDLLYGRAFRDLLGSGADPTTTTRTLGLLASGPAGAARPFAAYSVAGTGADCALLVTLSRGAFPFAGLVAAAQREGCAKIQVWANGGAFEGEPAGAKEETHEFYPSVANYDLDGEIDWVWNLKYAVV